MYKARKGVEIKGAKRDIIEEYANFGSKVYAPITRDGLSLDKKANKYEVEINRSRNQYKEITLPKREVRK